MKLVSVAEMRSIEGAAIASGISNEMMMENAGRHLAELIENRFKSQNSQTVIGLIGKGNNGGDTLVAMNYLLLKGWNCSAFLVNERDGDPLLKEFLLRKGTVHYYGKDNFSTVIEKEFSLDAVVLDGVLGTGIKLPLKEEISRYLAIIKSNIKDQFIIAVDCPSGIDCDSGETAKETLRANLTVCMEAVKLGLVTEPAFGYCGQILTVPLDLPDSVKAGSQKSVVDKKQVTETLPLRSPFSHKGSFGKVLVIGGSINYIGAPLIAGKAAYRLGSGLVTLAVPASVSSAAAGTFPEVTWLVLDEEGGVISEVASEIILREMNQYDCIVLGPGIGREETTERFLQRFLFEANKKNHKQIGFLEKSVSLPETVHFPPLVIDADGLRWLSKQEKWYDLLPKEVVLTPHPGEMSELTGLSVNEIQKNRLNTAQTFAAKWQKVVVLKGALTVIASPDGRSAVIPVASSALAKAGSGDALSGMIGSLLGQKIPCFESAAAAAWIHGSSGIAAAKKIGSATSVLASDIIAAVPDVLANLGR